VRVAPVSILFLLSRNAHGSGRIRDRVLSMGRGPGSRASRALAREGNWMEIAKPANNLACSRKG